MKLLEADKSRFIKKAFANHFSSWLNNYSARILVDIATLAQMDNGVFSAEFENALCEKIIKWVNSGAANNLHLDWNHADSHQMVDDLIVGYLEYLKKGGSRKDRHVMKKNAKDMFESSGLNVVHEGEDSSDADIIIFDSLENEKWFFVSPLSHEGAVFMDSFKCGGAGATWCIGTKDNDYYWNLYTHNGDLFMMAYNKLKFGSKDELKFMIQLGSDYSDEEYDVKHTQVWNQEDSVEFWEDETAEGKLQKHFGHTFADFVEAIIHNTFCDGHWHQTDWCDGEMIEDGDYHYNSEFSAKDYALRINKIEDVLNPDKPLLLNEAGVINIKCHHETLNKGLTPGGWFIHTDFINELCREKSINPKRVCGLRLYDAVIDKVAFDDSSDEYFLTLEDCQINNLDYTVLDAKTQILEIRGETFVNVLSYGVTEDEYFDINTEALSVRNSDYGYDRWYGHEEFAQPDGLNESTSLFESVLREADKSRFINRIFSNCSWTHNTQETVISYLTDAGLIDAHQEYNFRYAAMRDVLDFIGKESLIKWVNSGAADKYKIDWQNKSIEELTIKIIDAYCLSYKNKNIKDKKGDPKQMFSNEDRFKILHETEDWLFIMPMSWRACVFMDSFKCGGAGAKWCIGYAQSDNYWNEYTERGDIFVLAYNKKEFGSREKLKYMMQWKEGIGDYDNFVGWRQDDSPSHTLDWGEMNDLINGELDMIYEKASGAAVNRTAINSLENFLDGDIRVDLDGNAKVRIREQDIKTVSNLDFFDALFDCIYYYNSSDKPKPDLKHLIFDINSDCESLSISKLNVVSDYNTDVDIEFLVSSETYVFIDSLEIDWSSRVLFNGAFFVKTVKFFNTPDTILDRRDVFNEVERLMGDDSQIDTNVVIYPDRYEVDATVLNTKQINHVNIIPGNRYNIDCAENWYKDPFIRRTYFQLGDFISDTKDASYNGFEEMEYDRQPTHIYLYNLFSDDMNVPFSLAPTSKRHGPIYLHLSNCYVDCINVVDEASEAYIIPETQKTHVGLRVLNLK